jgi:hypothetical protein
MLQLQPIKSIIAPTAKSSNATPKHVDFASTVNE